MREGRAEGTVGGFRLPSSGPNWTNRIRRSVRAGTTTTLPPPLCTNTPLEAMSYRRVDSTDPRRPELVRPLTMPKSWKANELDVYASFLSSVSMVSSAAMLTRAPYIAYAGLIFACAHIAHDKPFKSSKTKDASTGGPWMSLA